MSKGLEVYQREEEAGAVGQGRKTGLWTACWVDGGLGGGARLSVWERWKARDSWPH